MASVHRQPGRPYWFCAFSIFEPQTNKWKRVFRSTKTSDRKQAQAICRTWEKASIRAHNGKLSADAAREVIAQGVSDVFKAANIESLESVTIKSWCEKWLEASQSKLSNPRTSDTSELLSGFSSPSGPKPSAMFPHCRCMTLHGSVIEKRKNAPERRQI